MMLILGMLIVAATIPLVVHLFRQPRRAEFHFEYTLHAERAGDDQVGVLLDRLAGRGRNLAAVALNASGEPAALASRDARLVGTQMQFRLSGDTGPGRLLLRLRRETDGGMFGLIEIDDEGSFVYRRFAGDVVRELGAMWPGLGYARLGSTDLLPVSGLEAGETL